MSSTIRQVLRNKIDMGIVAAIIIVTSFLVWQLPHLWVRNLWSLQFVWHISGSNLMVGRQLKSPPEGHPDALYWLAEEALREGDAGRAYSLIEPLAVQNDSEALMIMATALEYQGDIPSAMQTWLQLKDAEALVSAGDRANAAGYYEEALQAYQKALELEPTNIDAYIGLGILHYEQGEGFTSAFDEFYKAIRLDETYGRAYLAVAQVLTEEGHTLEAENWYGKAISCNPENLIWYLLRASSARDGNNLPLALNILHETNLLFPDNARVHFDLAWTYYLNEQLDEALADVEKALMISEQPNQWQYTRAGKIYESAGMLNQALTLYQAALEIDPQNRQALLGVERLGGE